MTNQPSHGVAVAAWSPSRGWRAVWITGRSGQGKSDLALRLLGRGWRLVADDYAYLFASGGDVWAACPAPLAGRIEARGLGVVAACARPIARVALVVELTDASVERMPDPSSERLAGLGVPLMRLNAFEASAAEKVALMLGTL